MARERKSRFKDNLRSSIREYDEAIAAVSAVEEEAEPVKPEAEKPREAVAEVESAPEPQAEEPKGEGSAPAEEEAPTQAPAGEGSVEPKAPRKKAAKPKGEAAGKKAPSKRGEYFKPGARKVAKISISTTEEIKDLVDKKCREEGRNRSMVVSDILADYFGIALR